MNEQEQVRRQNLTDYRNLGWGDGYNNFGTSTPAGHLAAMDVPHDMRLVYGRIVALRDLGKLVFITLRAGGGDHQIAFRQSDPDMFKPHETWTAIQLLNLGDIIYCGGRLANSKTGEPTVWAHGFGLIAKCLIPPPDKHAGLTDEATRIRNRHVDLFANPESFTLLRNRFLIIRETRRILEAKLFLEVDTPILQPEAGGAAAEPFMTEHRALGASLALRIAPELYLKRLLVGGFDRIFEIGKNFRNEGISARHSPEFTMLEAYAACQDHHYMADLTEKLVKAAYAVAGNPLPETPLHRVVFDDLVNASGFEGQDDAERWAYFEDHIQPTLKEPTFVFGPPASQVPLARTNVGFPTRSASFELIIDGIEIGCGYAEQNDPEAQAQAFLKQHDPMMPADAAFVKVLESGMPPAGGFGLGIDRLVMVATGAATIRAAQSFSTATPT